MTPPSALVVVAHPDDCEFSCGATVAKWTAAGARVDLLVLTDGSRGSHDFDLAADVLVARRRGEQRRGADRLGVTDVAFLDRPDGELAVSDELVEEIAAAVRARRPHVVVSHDPWRLYMLHPDHVAAGSATCNAVVRAREPRFYAHLAARGLPHWRPSELWLFSAERPNHVEVVDDTFETKLDAILCHESQYATSMGFEPGDEAGAERFRERLRRAAADVGAPVGARFGEAFHRLEL